MGLGSAENARFFSQTLEYPLEGLYADPTAACYKALGFYAPQADINPYVKLLAMLTGIGSPGTVQEVGWMGLRGVSTTRMATHDSRVYERHACKIAGRSMQRMSEGSAA